MPLGDLHRAWENGVDAVPVRNAEEKRMLMRQNGIATICRALLVALHRSKPKSAYGESVPDLYAAVETVRKDLEPIGYQAAADYVDTVLPGTDKVHRAEKVALLTELVAEVRTCIDQFLADRNDISNVESRPTFSERPIAELTANGVPYVFDRGQDAELARDRHRIAKDAVASIVESAVLLGRKNIRYEVLWQACFQQTHANFAEAGLNFPIWAKKNENVLNDLLEEAINRHEHRIVFIEDKGMCIAFRGTVNIPARGVSEDEVAYT